MKIISKCPTCGSNLKIAALRCSDCGLELRNDFELSPFDLLTPEQSKFLITFLKHRGNMSAVQNELEVSYPTAKKMLDQLLTALELSDNTPQITEIQEDINMLGWSIQKSSSKASDIIKQKLIQSGGQVVVHTMRGLPCEIRVAPDGVSFISDKLPLTPPYRYEVFDVIVDFLLSQGGRARKGNGRNHKLGEPDCDKTTVIGAISYDYSHKETGKSVYDPIFVLAAVLEWAEIARNGHGELALTASYLEKVRSAENGR